MLVSTHSSWNSHTLLVEIQNSSDTLENSFAVCIKLHVHRPPDPEILFLGLLIGDKKMCIHTKSCTSNANRRGIHNCQIWKQPKYPQQVSPHNEMHPYSGMPLSNREEQTADTHNTLDESQRHDVDWKKPVSKGYTVHNSMYMIFSKSQIYSNWGYISVFQS